MKLTEDMIQKIEEIAEDNRFDYEVIGVRVQEVPFELGSIDHVSHVWDDGEDTGEELSGLSCCRVDSLRDANSNGYYYGDYVAVIGGIRYEYGEDIGEIVIADPVVIAIIA